MNMTQIKNLKQIRFYLDPRTKLFLLMIAAVYISMQLSVTSEVVLIFIYILPVFIAGLYKWALIFLFVYTVQLLFSMHILPRMDIAFIVFILSYLTYGLRLLLPSMIAGVYSVKTTAVSEWIAAFKKMHMPKWLLIPLAVMTRFFPTIYEDYQHIRKAMVFRGIGTSFWELLKKPVQTLEFILIPLLMNATRVTEDLTVSSLTKGLGLAKKHTTMTQLKMTIYDWIYMVIALIPLILHLGGMLS